MIEPGSSGRLAGMAGLSCVVLGGGGFIGANLCRALRGAGARVRGFGRSRGHPEALDGVEWIAGALDGESDLAGVVAGADVVFHLVGGDLPESSNRDPAGTAPAAIRATVRLLDACRAAAVRRIVFASSGGTVYGVTAPGPIPETAPTDPISAYGITKLMVEKYLGLYRHLHGQDYAVARIANAYGPLQTARRGQGVVAALMRRAARGEAMEIWGDGLVVRDFIHIADVVEALAALAIHRGDARVFNVGSGVGRSIRSVADDVERAVGQGELPRRRHPGQRADVPANVLDIGLIGRETGWAPRVAWMDGLRDTLAWVRAQPAAD